MPGIIKCFKIKQFKIMKENVIKQHVDVNGVILTPEAIETLLYLQAHGNEGIKDQCRIFADAICFLASRLDSFTDIEKAEVMPIIQELSQVRQTNSRLKKP